VFTGQVPYNELVYESRTIGTKSSFRVVIGYDRHGGG
jgi:hypothetical protein